MSENSFNSEASSDDSIESSPIIMESEKEKETEKIKESNKVRKTPKSPEKITKKNLNLISSISDILNTILESNKKLKNLKEILKAQSKMNFSSNTIPNISIKDYLIRILTYSCVEKSTLILALILIDRVTKKSNFILTYYNIHRVLFTAVLISIKYNEDSYFDNNYYAQIAGVKAHELKILEYNFLEFCDFNVFVKNEIYEQYEKYLSDE